MRHNAGYSKYERWFRKEGENSTGEFWKDKANGWVNHLVLSGKKVLELACAKGFVVQDMRELGVDAWGMDVSAYAIGEADPSVQPFLTQGDVRTDLTQYANKEFDVVFSFRLLECLTDAEVAALVDELKRISKKTVMVVSLNPNPTYYNVKTLQEWLDNFAWAKGTVIAPYGDEFNYLTK